MGFGLGCYVGLFSNLYRVCFKIILGLVWGCIRVWFRIYLELV